MCLAGIAACSGGDDASPQSTSTTSSTVARRVRAADDGVLKIGVLRPADAATTDVAASIMAGVNLAIGDIRSSGQRVELIEAGEGEIPNTRASIEELADKGVDAIVGPMSSNIAMATLPTAVDLGLPTCSPTASSIALDNFPDRGLFFRTIASDRLQAKGLARLVERTGAGSAALINLDDGYGRPLADAVDAELNTLGITVRRYPFTRDERSIGLAAVELASNPSMVTVMISDASSARAVVEATLRALDGSSTTFVVNEATRHALADLPPDVLESTTITGLAPRIRPSVSSAFGQRIAASSTTGAFAENAFDCVNLFALAAAEASSTQPEAIAANVVDIAVSGSQCPDYTTCLPLVRDGRNIDYGALSLGTDGDLSDAVFDVFQIDVGGDQYVRSVTVSR